MKIGSSENILEPIKKNFGKIKGDEPLDVKKEKLKKATKEFESYFLLHMMKAMRKTIPESGLLDGGLGKDVYTGILDEEMARKMSGTSAGSIGEMLYKSLVGQLEATSKVEAEGGESAAISTDISEEPRVGSSKLVFPKEAAPPAAISRAKATEQPPVPIGQKPKITNDPILQKYGQLIDQASKKYNVHPQLIHSVIIAESGGRADAVSNKGAKGLMQLMDGTAEEMGVADSLDPKQNIFGGTKYLRKLMTTFDGDLKKALAAYNAGPGTVSKYNGVPPYRETQQYVEKILGRLPHAKKI